MSLIVSEIIELHTNDTTKVVRLLQIEKYIDGSGYGCDLAIVSGGFSCRHRFSFDDASLADAVQGLRSMAAKLAGKCVIKGPWEKDFIQIEVNDMGHVRVCGETFEYTEFTQHLKFAFQTDQTVLLPLARELQVLLDA